MRPGDGRALRRRRPDDETRSADGGRPGVGGVADAAFLHRRQPAAVRTALGRRPVARPPRRRLARGAR